MAMPPRRGLASLMGFAAPEEALPTGAGGFEGAPTGMGGEMPVGMDTGQLSTGELEGFAPPTEGLDPGLGGGEEMMGEEDQDYAEMEAAYNDPNTPPEIRRLLQMQLAMAARQALSGV